MWLQSERYEIQKKNKDPIHWPPVIWSLSYPWKGACPGASVATFHTCIFSYDDLKVGGDFYICLFLNLKTHFTDGQLITANQQWRGEPRWTPELHHCQLFGTCHSNPTNFKANLFLKIIFCAFDLIDKGRAYSSMQALHYKNIHIK